MEDTLQQAVLAAVTDVLNDHQENGTLANLSVTQLQDLAALFQESGFFNLLLPEELGGAELNLQQCLAVLLQEGAYALPVALASTNLANAWLHTQGLDVAMGAVAIESVSAAAGLSGLAAENSTQSNSVAQDGANGHESSKKGLISIGIKAQNFTHLTPQILLAVADKAYLLDATHYVTDSVDRDHSALWLNLNLEHAKALEVNAEAVQKLHDLAVLSSIAVSQGAMRQLLEMTVKYAAERTQFGRKLSQFQAIQQQLSVMAECVCSAQMAAELAYYSDSTVPNKNHLILAKHQMSLVANQVANIAHAVHGAIGITKEYPLHFYTQIIRQNRSQGGSEMYWAEQLGAAVLQSDKTVLEILSGDLLWT